MQPESSIKLPLRLSEREIAVLESAERGDDTVTLSRSFARRILDALRSAEQSQGVTDEMVMTAMRAFGSVYGDLNPEYASDDQRLAFRRALEAVNASQPSQDAPTGKNVLETVEKYRREHPGALERAEAEMIAEEAGVYDYTCPHCLKVFKAIYGQDFPHCPYCAKQLTWWPEASQRTQQAESESNDA